MGARYIEMSSSDESSSSSSSSGGSSSSSEDETEQVSNVPVCTCAIITVLAPVPLSTRA